MHHRYYLLCCTKCDNLTLFSHTTMVRKIVDGRVQGLIEQGVRRNHRSIFVIVGDHGKDQVENLHRLLSRSRVKARPSVLWCYKKELGFSTHRKKRMREIKRNQARGLHDPDRDDPFDLFISSTDIRWTYYKESEKILGQTFGMCVLQDFEALTPNLLARTIETVEGGGLIIFLLKTVRSLKQLYTMTMDVHSRFRTESHHEVVPRFNERFILSLADCGSCLVLDDELNILPISSSVESIPSSSGDLLGSEAVDGDEDDQENGQAMADLSGTYLDPELEQLKASLSDTPKVGSLVALTKTKDQALVVMAFLDRLSERKAGAAGISRGGGVVSLTAGRGRGKSAALGLCLAGAVSFGWANIFLTAPAPENLKTVFQFLISGLQALRYIEHVDYSVTQTHDTQGDAGKIVVRVDIFREHRQTVQYIVPSDHLLLAQAELVAVDEAAAIPLPVVKKLMGGGHLSLLSSTIHGYEGTGRSLSLKLIQQLRMQQGAAAAAAAQQAGAAVKGPKHRGQDTARHLHEDRWKTAAGAATGGTQTLTELALTQPIRYGNEDPVEKWLNTLLCMDAVSPAAAAANRLVGSLPAPKDCDLFLVNRDALFSFHALSEAFLQRVWALYTSAHYKSSPNDLQMLSDAPAHRLFVLLGPQKQSKDSSSSKEKGVVSQLPDVLCVVQVAFEGRISQKSVQSELSKGNKASGDMIPWTIVTQFSDNSFAELSGARIVRIATHPDVQKMGYGSRAVDLLISYFAGEITARTLEPTSGVFGGEGADSLEKTKTGDNNGTAEGSSGGLSSERLSTRSKLPPLLTPLSERTAERLHWIGVSFGLTAQLLHFWSRKGFRICYLRQTASELTGEHSAVLLRDQMSAGLGGGGGVGGNWLKAFVSDYRRRLISLMGYSLRSLEAALAIALLDPDRQLTSAADSSKDDDEQEPEPGVSLKQKRLPGESGSSSSDQIEMGAPLKASELLNVHLSLHDMRRLELYSRNMVDHHMILDTVPTLASLVFQGRLPSIRLSYLQVAILLAVGLQRRDVDSISSELDLPSNQVLAFFNKTIRKVTVVLKEMVEKHVSRDLHQPSTAQLLDRVAGGNTMQSLNESLQSIHADDERVASSTIRDAVNLKSGLGGTVPSVVSLPKSAVTGDPLLATSTKNSADDEEGAGGDDAAAGQDTNKKRKKHKKKHDHADR